MNKVMVNCPVHGLYQAPPISAANTGCPKCWKGDPESMRFDNQERLLNGQTPDIQELRGKHG